MKNLKSKLIKNVAKVFINVGEVGAISYSIPINWYEPKVPEALLKSKK